MRITRKYFLSAALRTLAAITLIAGTAGILSSSAMGQTRSWSAAGATGTVDEDSAAIYEFKNFAINLKPGATGTVRIRYNITAVDSLNQFCPATASTIKVRFRNSDNSGVSARVAFELKFTNVLSGGSTTLYTFTSDGIGLGNSFTTATATPAIDFDFLQNVYWIDATIFRNNAAQFADLGSIQIWESAGTACP
jgi:hypothetical protein